MSGESYLALSAAERGGLAVLCCAAGLDTCVLWTFESITRDGFDGTARGRLLSPAAFSDELMRLRTN